MEPAPEDLYECHFVIFGLDEEMFRGGVYHGRMKVPRTYPVNPPEIRMLTPNGRFVPNRAICLSTSSFHPEEWNPGMKLY